MPKQLNNGNVTAALQRAFGFKGRYRPMLDEVIVPVYQIADPVPAAPQALCIGTNVDSGAGALEFVVFQFFNPTGSGVVAQMSSVAFGVLGPGDPPIPEVFIRMQMRFITEKQKMDLTSPSVQFNNGFFRDQRAAITALSESNRPLCQLISDSARTTSIPGADRAAFTLIKTDDTLAELVQTFGGDIRQPAIVLPPGRGIEIAPATANANDTALGMVCTWLEVAESQTNPSGGSPP